MSRALMPSIESTVARLSKSVRDWIACATHSPPALVVKAYWNGEVASCTAGSTNLCCNCFFWRQTTSGRLVQQKSREQEEQLPAPWWPGCILLGTSLIDFRRAQHAWQTDTPPSRILERISWGHGRCLKTTSRSTGTATAGTGGSGSGSTSISPATSEVPPRESMLSVSERSQSSSRAVGSTGSIWVCAPTVTNRLAPLWWISTGGASETTLSLSSSSTSVSISVHLCESKKAGTWTWVAGFPDFSLLAIHIWNARNDTIQHIQHVASWHGLDTMALRVCFVDQTCHPAGPRIPDNFHSLRIVGLLHPLVPFSLQLFHFQAQFPQFCGFARPARCVTVAE